MTKRLLLGAMMVALVCALVGGATFAVFTSTAANTANNFTAGELNVDLDNETSAYFSVSNMAPGDTNRQYVIVKNTESLDAIFKMYVDPTTNEANISDYLKVKITLNPSDYTGGLGGFNNYGTANSVVFNNTLTNLLGAAKAIDNVSASFEDPAWPLKVGYAAVYKVEVEFDKNAGDTLQGKQFVGDIVVKATQAKNQTQSSVQW